VCTAATSCTADALRQEARSIRSHLPQKRISLRRTLAHNRREPILSVSPQNTAPPVDQTASGRPVADGHGRVTGRDDTTLVDSSRNPNGPGFLRTVIAATLCVCEEMGVLIYSRADLALRFEPHPGSSERTTPGRSLLSWRTTRTLRPFCAALSRLTRRPNSRTILLRLGFSLLHPGLLHAA